MLKANDDRNQNVYQPSETWITYNVYVLSKFNLKNLVHFSKWVHFITVILVTSTKFPFIVFNVYKKF